MRAAAALLLQCTYALIHQYPCLPFIVRMCPLAWPSGLQGQVNPLASSETTVLKTRFGPGDGSQSCPSPKVHARLEALTAARYLDSLRANPVTSMWGSQSPREEFLDGRLQTRRCASFTGFFARGSIFRQLDRNDDVIHRAGREKSRDPALQKEPCGVEFPSRVPDACGPHDSS